MVVGETVAMRSLGSALKTHSGRSGVGGLSAGAGLVGVLVCELAIDREVFAEV